MTAGRICNREVDLAEPAETVQVAASRMHSRNVGTLVVIDEGSRPIGILTDRDLAIRVVGQGLHPAETTVRAVMSNPPRSVTESTSIESAITHMRSGPFRRMIVTDDDGRLVGLLSLDDVLDLLAEEFQEIGRLIRREGPRALADQP